MADAPTPQTSELEEQVDAAYEQPAILALGDVNTETLQTGIPG